MSQGGVMPTGMQNQTASLKPPTSPTPGMGNQMGGFGGQAMSGTPGGFGMPSGGFGGTAGKPSAPGGQTMPMQGSGVGLGAMSPGQLGQLSSMLHSNTAALGAQNIPTQQGQFLQNMMQNGQSMQQAMPNLGGLFGNVQNATQSLPGGGLGALSGAGGLASLVPQQPGLAHYGPQGRGHQ